MKRFFTLLMAVWALLSISQTVKAADSPTGNDAKYYLFGSMNGWKEKYCPFTTTDDGKTYTCTLSNQNSTVYFKPKISADGPWLALGLITLPLLQNSNQQQMVTVLGCLKRQVIRLIPLFWIVLVREIQRLSTQREVLMMLLLRIFNCLMVKQH